ncbi:hypothetical protein C1X61_11235 [Pseudomonas sp. FW215-T2]|nr:hypothetical protein C1X61_11235 [Pseudomonas sp. FW215-T2]PNA12269.1 hypothetical protein C1X62_12870 [Pseudomonas sp. FW215-R3]PNB37438.1 hypothetical protein C1X63_13060 [Pseudomonas sp. FW305-131]
MLEDHDEITAFFRVNDARELPCRSRFFKGADGAKPVGASLLAMDANDNAGNLTPRVFPGSSRASSFLQRSVVSLAA